jgi:hypothetical protein
MGPRGASRSTARLLQNARDGQKLGESFKCPESFKTHTLPHPYLDKYVPGVIEDAGALVNEKRTSLAFRVTMDVFDVLGLHNLYILSYINVNRMYDAFRMNDEHRKEDG